MPAITDAYSPEQVRGLLRLSCELSTIKSVGPRRERLLAAMCQACGAVSGCQMLLDDCVQCVGDLCLVHSHLKLSGERPIGQQPIWAEPFFRMSNPMSQPFLAAFAGRLMEPTARSRRQLVSDASWYGSEYFDRHRRNEGLDDCIICAVPLPGNKPFLSAVCLNRLESSPEPFSIADCDTVELMHAEFRWACVSHPLEPENWLEPEQSKPQIEVPPRFRRVLVRMLAGDSEKQIAQTLALSRHTIHEYIRSLYRELGVSSKGELMAKFVSRESA
jgi:DNA-binding CsgD family transcriptional regulator